MIVKFVEFILEDYHDDILRQKKLDDLENSKKNVKNNVEITSRMSGGFLEVNIGGEKYLTWFPWNLQAKYEEKLRENNKWIVIVEHKKSGDSKVFEIDDVVELYKNNRNYYKLPVTKQILIDKTLEFHVLRQTKNPK
jgi:hypothetical protein